MIPDKVGHSYAISFIHPHWEGCNYSDPAIYNGEISGFRDEIWYGFNIPDVKETIWFAKQDIIGELKTNNE